MAVASAASAIARPPPPSSRAMAAARITTTAWTAPATNRNGHRWAPATAVTALANAVVFALGTFAEGGMATGRQVVQLVAVEPVAPAQRRVEHEDGGGDDEGHRQVGPGRDRRPDGRSPRLHARDHARRAPRSPPVGVGARRVDLGG